MDFSQQCDLLHFLCGISRRRCFEQFRRGCHLCWDRFRSELIYGTGGSDVSPSCIYQPLFCLDLMQWLPAMFVRIALQVSTVRRQNKLASLCVPHTIIVHWVFKSCHMSIWTLVSKRVLYSAALHRWLLLSRRGGRDG